MRRTEASSRAPKFDRVPSTGPALDSTATAPSVPQDLSNQVYDKLYRRGSLSTFSGVGNMNGGTVNVTVNYFYRRL